MVHFSKSTLTLGLIDTQPGDDYDWADRVNRKHTVIILLCLAFILGIRQLISPPITCWCPAHFTQSHERFTNDICWAKDTYYLPFAEETSESLDEPFNYYRWVPLVFIFQALVLYLPGVIWRFLNQFSGLDISSILEAAEVCRQAPYMETGQKAVSYIVKQLEKYRPIQGIYITCTYLVVKCLYIGIAVGQMVLVNEFLAPGHFWTPLLLIKGSAVSARFPRSIVCDLQVRRLGQVHRYSVQCSMTLNVHIEKMFVGLWFWFTVMLAINSVTFIRWLIRFVYWPGQVHYIHKKLQTLTATQEAVMLANFTGHLKRDDMFIIHLVGVNMGEAVAGEVLGGMWNNYKFTSGRGPERGGEMSEFPETKC